MGFYAKSRKCQILEYVCGVLTGLEIMKLSDEVLLNKIENTNLFAEVDPNQKERIILC